MLALVVEFRVHPAHEAEFEAALLDNAHQSRSAEPGCRQFDVCRDDAEPGLFYLYELYVDDDAVQAHLRAAHFLHFNALTAGWVVSKAVRLLRRQAPV